jgi:hypothetical protein
MRNTISSLVFTFVVGTAATACTASGSAQYSASATMPSMVYISPGVQVIEDYDQPVFYSSSFYWHYNDGLWYRSRSYTGGWVRVTAAPAAIVRIQQPSMYVHYHASASGDAQANGRATAVQQEQHHEAQEEHRDEKREVQQERRDDKQERHDDKQERKVDDHDNGQKGHKK